MKFLLFLIISLCLNPLLLAQKTSEGKVLKLKETEVDEWDVPPTKEKIEDEEFSIDTVEKWDVEPEKERSKPQAKPKKDDKSAPSKKKKVIKRASLVQADQDTKVIYIGSTVPKTGEGSVIGNNIEYGISLYTNKTNRQGGINDVEFRVAIKDDARDVVRSRENVEELMKQTPLILSSFGTRTLISIKDYIERKQVLALFPFAGSLEMRNQELKNIIYYRAPSKGEIEALINYTIDTLQRERIALFYEDSIQGIKLFEFAKKILKKRGIKYDVSAPYQSGTVNITSAVKKIVEHAPHAVICIADAKPSYYFIRQTINKGLHGTAFLGTARLVPIQKVLEISRGVTKLITSSLVPNPYSSQLQIAKEYRENMAKFYPNISLTPISFEAYIAAELLGKYVNELRAPFTTEKLVKQIEKSTDENYKGLPLNFYAPTRTLSQHVWINVGRTKEWPIIKIDVGSYDEE